MEKCRREGSRGGAPPTALTPPSRQAPPLTKSKWKSEGKKPAAAQDTERGQEQGWWWAWQMQNDLPHCHEPAVGSAWVSAETGVRGRPWPS